MLLLLSRFSHVRLCATPWTAAYQVPPSMGFFQARVLEWGAIAFSKNITEVMYSSQGFISGGGGITP